MWTPSISSHLSCSLRSSPSPCGSGPQMTATPDELHRLREVHSAPQSASTHPPSYRRATGDSHPITSVSALIPVAPGPCPGNCKPVAALAGWGLKSGRSPSLCRHGPLRPAKSDHRRKVFLNDASAGAALKGAYPRHHNDSIPMVFRRSGFSR